MRAGWRANPVTLGSIGWPTGTRPHRTVEGQCPRRYPRSPYCFVDSERFLANRSARPNLERALRLFHSGQGCDPVSGRGLLAKDVKNPVEQPRNLVQGAAEQTATEQVRHRA